MTATAHWLIRLHGNEDWDAWGQDWADHVDKVADLHWIDDFMPSPNWLREHPSRQLDWRAFLYEMRAHEISPLFTRPPSDQLGAAWQQQLELLETLYLRDFRYAVVWIEEPEDSQPGQPSTDPTGYDRRIYIRPHFPTVPFYLVALDGGWSMGPFNDNFYADGLATTAPAGLLGRMVGLPGATAAAVTTSACGSATRTATSSTPTTGTSGQCVTGSSPARSSMERTGTTLGLTVTYQ